ncbi:MAG: type I DNA topoisomerase [Acidobacteriota bacterium]
MSKSLVVVESPSKAKTINKYLGKDFVVMASIGHIKDLPEKGLGVDIKKNFAPTYQIIPDARKKNNRKILAGLKAAAQEATAIYLAADPDREGEAICQHLKEELAGRGNNKPVYRVLFNEITKDAITRAFHQPGQIDTNKVDAQQARRVLDRLVGYQVSPLLCRKVGGKLSAGRVQSVALRLVVEREREILSFQSTEYWTIAANLSAKRAPAFDAKLYKVEDKTVKTSDFETVRKTEIHINDAEQAEKIVAEAQAEPFVITSISTKEKKRYPVPPFITSKLQQEAARKLRFPVRKTMQVAQKLYEGVELEGGEVVGLITYMRTDSTRISESALDEARTFIDHQYGKNYLPDKAILYQNKKGAQDAHEAIRPTSCQRTPDSIVRFLSKDEQALYKLIWQRFIASQMKPALFDETIIDISAGAKYLFRAKGMTLKFDGFLAVYVEGKDEKDDEDEELALRLPPMQEGDRLKLNRLLPEQNFTKPATRYNEATLVKALEEKGIGRPSTYAQIITIIQNRAYVEKVDGRFKPTELGIVVNDVLVQSFDDIFNVSYTAEMEGRLDKIEEGGLKWQAALDEFYSKFTKDLKAAEENITKAREGVMTEEICHKCGGQMMLKLGRFGRFLACPNEECKATRDAGGSGLIDAEGENPYADEVCDKCGRAMALKRGRWGQFLACSGYPECKTTRKIAPVASGVKSDVLLSDLCPQCGKNLIIKHGRYGQFTACSNYPECKYVRQETTGVACPREGCTGEIVVKKSKRGRVFYGCKQYPECDIVYWEKPIAQACPQCGTQLLFEKITKRDGTVIFCRADQCGYRNTIVPPEKAESPKGSRVGRGAVQAGTDENLRAQKAS